VCRTPSPTRHQRDAALRRRAGDRAGRTLARDLALALGLLNTRRVTHQAPCAEATAYDSSPWPRRWLKPAPFPSLDVFSRRVVRCSAPLRANAPLPERIAGMDSRPVAGGTTTAPGASSAARLCGDPPPRLPPSSSWGAPALERRTLPARADPRCASPLFEQEVAGFRSIRAQRRLFFGPVPVSGFEPLPTSHGPRPSVAHTPRFAMRWPGRVRSPTPGHRRRHHARRTVSSPPLDPQLDPRPPEVDDATSTASIAICIDAGDRPGPNSAATRPYWG